MALDRTGRGRTTRAARRGSTRWSGAKTSASSRCRASLRWSRSVATVVSSDAELWIPTATPDTIFRDAPAKPAPITATRLNPRHARLEAWVFVPDALYRHLGKNPELADVLKSDLADSLARGADEAFLGADKAFKDGGVPPPGHFLALSELTRPGDLPDGDLLEKVRHILSGIRQKPTCHFRSPGWILDPRTLDDLTRLDSTATTLDRFRLLTLDGSDGGTLVGLPFVTSGAAAVQPRRGSTSRPTGAKHGSASERGP